MQPMEQSGINRRTMLRWGAVLSGGLVAGTGVLLTGCGSDDTTTPKPHPTGTKRTPRIAHAPADTPADALALLKAGNARFVANKPEHPDETAARRAALASGQDPFAVILSCVDSRVPPELVFDRGLGDLFVSRSAGQVLDRAVRGSIQYGILELKVPLLVVLGHEKCGAVKATLEAVEHHSAPLGNDIDALVTALKPAVEQAEAEHAADPLDAAVRYNVRNIVADLGRDATLAPAVAAGALQIMGARYDLDTGAVEFI
jgi:carbonic anhydrase